MLMAVNARGHRNAKQNRPTGPHCITFPRSLSSRHTGSLRKKSDWANAFPAVPVPIAASRARSLNRQFPLNVSHRRQMACRIASACDAVPIAALSRAPRAGLLHHRMKKTNSSHDHATTLNKASAGTLLIALPRPTSPAISHEHKLCRGSRLHCIEPDFVCSMQTTLSGLGFEKMPSLSNARVCASPCCTFLVR